MYLYQHKQSGGIEVGVVVNNQFLFRLKLFQELTQSILKHSFDEPASHILDVGSLAMDIEMIFSQAYAEVVPILRKPCKRIEPDKFRLIVFVDPYPIPDRSALEYTEFEVGHRRIGNKFLIDEVIQVLLFAEMLRL